MSILTTRPDVLPALQELQARPQWVCWRKEVRKGKLTKVPYNAATGRYAQSDNPATWTSYERASFALQQQPDLYDGVGYMFHRDLTGVDLDHCVDADGRIEAWAQDIIERLPSYAEYSPSGTGVHILVRGDVPRGLRRKVPGALHAEAALEMYCEGRYFTISGKHIEGTPVTLAACSAELVALHAEMTQPLPQQTRTQLSLVASLPMSEHDLIQKARNAKDGAKFWALWNGDTSGYVSQSEAELALCTLLAFWTGKDAHQIDRLFRQSRMYREEKWDRNARSGETYGAGTIARALEACTEVYTPRRERVQTSASGNGGSGAGGVATGTQTPDDSRDLPEIILGGDQLRDTTNQAIAALMGLERKTPTLFLQSARLVRVGHNEMKRPIVTQMGVAEVKEVLTHSANYYRLRKVPGSDGEWEKVPTSPPKEIAEQILARQTQRPYLPFPPLVAIVETPVIRPDGTILERPGYDKATRLYYAPQAGMDACTIPLTPTQAERDAALTLLKETIGEFPYVDEADYANALALLLTPILRQAIKRHVPLALLDAPKAGTGKGLLADVVSLIATGTSSAVLTMSDSDEELQKALTSLLIEGATIITIDNITGRLQSRHLDAALTADMWRGRMLGQSKMVLVPQRATWLATGNNIRLGGDLARRCYRIRLDPHVSRPWMRSGFRHEDLAGWVLEQRPQLIRALLILARAWYAAGQPIAPDVPALGTFTSWAKTAGSILAYAGVSGFLSNLETLYEEADEDNAQWETFLHVWLETFGSQWIALSDVISKMEVAGSDAGSSSQLPANDLVEALPETLQIALKEKPKSFKIRLGKGLEKRVDTCFGIENVRLERARDGHKKLSRWRCLRGVAGSCSVATQGEKNLLSICDDVHENESKNEGNNSPQLPASQNSEMRSIVLSSRMKAESIPPEKRQNAGSWDELPASESYPCTTRWERIKSGRHAAAATRLSEGYWWCDRCEPQRQFMEIGMRRGFPAVALAQYKLAAGREVWLRFVQEAGYVQVQKALAHVQHMEAEA